MSLLPDATASGTYVVMIGANFEGANQGIAGGVIPPDTDGAVGPSHFVELVNGAYRVYDKSGALFQESSFADFWSSAGVSSVAGFDPRALCDHDSGRWFAAAL